MLIDTMGIKRYQAKVSKSLENIGKIACYSRVRIPYAPLFFVLYRYTTLQLIIKKDIVQGFLMYNEFDQTITKESDPVR